MNILEIILLCIVIFICVFATVDRICKCIEYCAIGKTYNEAIKAQHDGKPENSR